MEPTTIGRVTASEKDPSTCGSVRFWVQKDVVIKPFDIVKISHIPSVPRGKPSSSYAIVQELKYITDSAGHLANYVSADFGDVNAEPGNSRMGTTIAEAEILYNDQDVEMPIRDFAPVQWADAEGIRDALGLRGLKTPIPAGYIRLTNAREEVRIDLEAAYLIGPEGAHVNIAGISGLATKTSYAMFLLSSIQQTIPDRASIILFNVKGRDLLALDEENTELTDGQRNDWARCGLKAKPFNNVTYLYPYAERQERQYTTSHVEPDILARQIENNRAFNYFYDLPTGLSRLPLLFSDIDDSSSTMESIAHSLLQGDFSSWDNFKSEIKKRTRPGGDANKEITVASWRKFQRIISTRMETDLFGEKCTTRGQLRRQKLVNEAIAELRPGSVLVVDIEPLRDYLKCLVVGDVIRTVLDAKLGDNEHIEPEQLGTVVIFADELNKYAPKTGTDRTLTHELLEISERGRSLGVVLFGAEQFRSHVHDRVHGNCSTNVYGRTSPVEIEKCADYRHFPSAYKSALTRLPKGILLVQHAVFKTALVKVNFPFPAYHQPKVDEK